MAGRYGDAAVPIDKERGASRRTMVGVAIRQHIKEDMVVSETSLSSAAPKVVPPLTPPAPHVAPVDVRTHVSVAPPRVPQPLTPRWQAIKRGVDIAVSLPALIVLAPLMACLALLIKRESRGPALFVQERIGLNGKVFMLYKFRSMRVDAERHSGPVFAKQNDPRCTRIGRFMRRYSLDELPQLINVLRGDMSLIGPRPERPYFVAQFSQNIPHYHDRHRVKTGITGWAQVNGLRGDTSIEERIRYDLHYIEHWSPLLDTRILLRTISEIIHGRNAF